MAQERDEVASDAVTELKSKIENTRARIAGTVDAIERRLRPRRLVAEAGDTIREAAVRPLHTARMHPVLSVAIAMFALAVVGSLIRRHALHASDAGAQ